MLVACDSADVRCETVTTTTESMALALPTALPLDRTDASLTLTLRYRDLAAPTGEYDPQELADSAWSLARSDYATTLEIARQPIPTPKTETDLHNLHPDLKAVGSDWQPWRRYKECPIGCEHAYYLSEDWGDKGLAHIDCEEVENRNPFLITCIAHDALEGVQIAYTFPAKQKAHLADFRARIADFLKSARTVGDRHCN